MWPMHPLILPALDIPSPTPGSDSARGRCRFFGGAVSIAEEWGPAATRQARAKNPHHLRDRHGGAVAVARSKGLLTCNATDRMRDASSQRHVFTRTQWAHCCRQ